MPALGPMIRWLRDFQTGKESDRELLDRFSASGEEDAFTALVRRHGGMVQGVCRRILGDDHAAEDVFQAAFLVLARKAGSVRWRESVANWLYGVAYRLAHKARVQGARRRRQEQGAHRQEAVGPARPEIAELSRVLDEELYAMPARYRLPILLCCLHDQTVDEAAGQLGWSFGMVKGRLQRGRELLRDRLRRRGVALSVGVLAGILGEGALRAVPPYLIASTMQAAIRGPVPASVAILMKGALRAMFWNKVCKATMVLMVVGVIGGGSFFLTSSEPAGAVPVPERVRETATTSPDRPLPLPLMESQRGRVIAVGEDTKPAVATVCRGPRHLLPAAIPSPYEIVANRPAGKLQQFAAGKAGLEGPTSDRPALVYLAGPVLNSGERWCPVGLSRSGNRFILELESWTDDGPRLKNIPGRDTYLLSLGTLPAGDYELLLEWKGFFFTYNRDRSTGLEQYAWTSYRTAKLPFKVTKDAAGGQVAKLHEREFRTEKLPRDAAATYRQMPQYWMVRLKEGGNLNGLPKPGLRVGRLNLTQWLNTQPANLGDFAGLCKALQPPQAGSQSYGIILGPTLRAGDHMTLREVVWNGTKVTLKVDVWATGKADADSGRSSPVLITTLGTRQFPPARPRPYDVEVEWRWPGRDPKETRPLTKGFINHERFLMK